MNSRAVSCLLPSVLAAAAIAVSALATTPVQAAQDDPIAKVLQGRASEWQDGFDTGSVAPAEVRTVTPIMSAETVVALQYAIQTYADIVARGGWPVVPADKALRLGMRDPNVEVLRQRLIVSGDLAYSAGASGSFDTYVEAAVRRFQSRHGIPADGVVGASTIAALNIPASVRLGQLSKNLDRLKELTAKPVDRFVMVNIPAARVEAVELGRVISRHNAVVGRVDRPSPIVNSKIYEINFNPFWTVPASIIKKDLIPYMQKNPQYLTNQKIRIYDKKGNEVQPTAINWQTDEATNYLYRQDPGEINSMGSVKINFHSPDGVYMHDTPNKGLFVDDYRFDSSGCVRVENIRELIIWLLRDTPGWSRDQVDYMFRSGERLDAKLEVQVPVFFAYVTAWAAQDGVVNFRDDIYNGDGLDQLALQ
jgi:murein L,D-transpeptidase YcbB/YkuD